MATKENSGKAARRKFFRRLWTILFIFAVTLFGLFLLGVGQERKPQLRRIQATTLEYVIISFMHLICFLWGTF
jgi:hypothetical protein